MAYKKKARMLLLEDDVDLAEVIRDYYVPRGYVVDYYEDPLIPLSKFRQSQETPPYDVVLSDLKMPNFDGLMFIREMKKLHPELPIVLMTAYGGVETAIEATRSGAFHFVLKPINFQILTVTLENAVEKRRARNEITSLKQALDATKVDRTGLFARSPKMAAVIDLAKRVARSNSNVLIHGESGTGKEVIARMIHDLGQRADGPFVAINCSAIPETLMESELFGYARGAFTGANDKKQGLFEEAGGGTLFLDEIGDLSLPLQVKLLRVIQERKIKRLGENVFRKVDVRILAATHKSLENEVRAKTFREDLFFRLNVIQIKIPPLRDRAEDILPLSEFFLKKFSLSNNVAPKKLSKEAADKIMKQRWEGNVRELENAMERAVVLATSDVIGPNDVGTNQFLMAGDADADPAQRVALGVAPETVVSPQERRWSGAEVAQAPAEFKPLLEKLRLSETQNSPDSLPTLEDVELIYIAYVFRRAEEVKERAAGILNIDRKTLYKKLRNIKPIREPAKIELTTQLPGNAGNTPSIPVAVPPVNASINAPLDH